MRPLARLLVALAAAGCAAVGPAVAAEAAGSGSVTTGPRAEGWYRTAPVCALPTGCPQTPSPYAPDTLHIGVNAGTEEARTALQLDLGRLPAGTKPVGGQLRLPIATGPQDGTRNPETAKLRACLVDAPVKDVDGSFGAPPDADCDAVGVDAAFVPGTAKAPAAFTVDLSALAAAWQEAAVPGALALVPGKVGPTDTWHVALSDRTRVGAGVARVTAALSFVSASFETDEAPPPVFAPIDGGGSAFAPAPASGFSADVPAFSASGPAAPAAPVPAPAPAAVAPAPQAAAPAAVVPVASFVDAGFRYPAVFLLPLGIAAVVAWAGRAMTRDLAAAQGS